MFADAPSKPALPSNKHKPIAKTQKQALARAQTTLANDEPKPWDLGLTDTRANNTQRTSAGADILKTVTTTYKGKTYTATLRNSGSVCIDVDNLLVGAGHWNGQMIENCPAVLPDEVYDALDALLISIT